MPTNPGSPTQSRHAATGWNWLAVAIICAATILSGVALIEWMWPLFWAGVGLVVGGAGLAWRTGIMDATSEWHPPYSPPSAAGPSIRRPSTTNQPTPSGES